MIFYDVKDAKLTSTSSSSLPASARNIIDLPIVQDLVKPAEHVRRTRHQLTLEERVLLVSVCAKFKSAPDSITSLSQPSKNLRAETATVFADVALDWLSADRDRVNAVRAKLNLRKSPHRNGLLGFLADFASGSETTQPLLLLRFFFPTPQLHCVTGITAGGTALLGAS